MKILLSTDIVGSDAYLSLPFPAQALYIQLCIAADDDGFVQNTHAIVRMTGAGEDALAALMNKHLLIRFEDKDLYCIKHWLIHNDTAKLKRYRPSSYIVERAKLKVTPNRAYTLDDYGEYLPIKKSAVTASLKPTMDDIRQYATERGLNVDIEAFYAKYSRNGWRTKDGKPISNWKSMLKAWERREKT